MSALALLEASLARPLVLVVAAWLLAGDRQGRLQRFWPLVVLAAGEAPQFTTPLPLLLSLLVWLLLLWNPVGDAEGQGLHSSPQAVHLGA